MKVRIIGDPMSSKYGASGPLILLAKEFRKRGVDLEIVSSIIKPEIRTELEKYASVIDLGFKNTLLKDASTSYVEIWLREAVMHQLSRRAEQLINSESSATDVTINMSNTIAIKSTVWFAQAQFPKLWKISIPSSL